MVGKCSDQLKSMSDHGGKFEYKYNWVGEFVEINIIGGIIN